MNKPMKRFACILLSLLLVLSAFMTVLSEEFTSEYLYVVTNSVNITVDDQIIANIGDTYALENGTVVPFSTI